MFLAECFEKDSSKAIDTFLIPGTNKDVLVRRAKDKFGFVGIKCKVSQLDKETIKVVVNNTQKYILIKEV